MAHYYMLNCFLKSIMIPRETRETGKQGNFQKFELVGVTWETKETNKQGNIVFPQLI